jgi:hypothetical protein
VGVKFNPGNYLTSGQQKVLCVTLLLLLTGLAVKVWRTTHPEFMLEHRTTGRSQKP